MDELKKGIEPTKEDNAQTQLHINKVWNTCLLLFAAFVVLVVVGEYLKNPVVTSLGLGIGTAAGIITSTLLFGGKES